MIFRPSTIDVHSRMDSALAFRDDERALPQPPRAPGEGATPELGVDACDRFGDAMEGGITAGGRNCA